MLRLANIASPMLIAMLLAINIPVYAGDGSDDDEEAAQCHCTDSEVGCIENCLEPQEGGASWE